jgi:branched-chain amino acid transport system ATP-binding protein
LRKPRTGSGFGAADTMACLLEVEGINSYYGHSHVLFDVSLQVADGETVALLGRNGAGKTTTLRSIMGVLPPRSGSIRFAGQEIGNAPPEAIARLGMQLVPESRDIFGGLTVEENLTLAALTAPGALAMDVIYTMFPRLRERRRSRGRNLSGGEQQMLSIARALIREPKVVLLDEPFEGLAPLIVAEILRTCRAMVERRKTVVIVEQNVSAALSLADRCYIMNNGQVVWEGTPAALRESPDVVDRYLGV